MDLHNKTKDELIKIIEEMREELRIAYKIIYSYDNIKKNVSYKLYEITKALEAYETALELSREEQIEKEKIIKAYEKAQELAREELKDRDKIIEAHEKVEELAFKELMEKDKKSKNK
ncbi:MAG TPA: hypothetical protein PKW55_05580 [Spirochaetota bacterium]|nr:hypothetical protein [Spirochaetota bacterium]HOM37578.1 hypothetical protein [Spirochaetota bacterium]HPQ49451.1 hypothetical protein [Spirochaetota bacterium]